MTKARKNNLRGAAFMLLAVATFSLMDAALKTLSQHYPAAQVAALRGWTTLPIVTIWVGFFGGYRALVAIRWPLHLLRGALSVVMLVSFTYALKRLPLTEAYSIFFVAPLLITASSGPLLGERVQRQHWIAIAIGLIGVLIVLRPRGDGVLTLAGLAVLVSAASYALSAICVRILGRTDSTSSMIFWMILMLSLGATALAWPNWQPLRWTSDWPSLLVLAITGSVGQYAITEAFRRAQAAVIAPLEYTALAWGLALDWWLWQHLPDAVVYLGAALIIVSGLYLLRHERQHVEAEHP